MKPIPTWRQMADPEKWHNPGEFHALMQQEIERLRERLAELENQKPVLATNRCNIEGAEMCTCDELCTNTVDLYLSAGAKPAKPADVEGHPV